jgi:magnesium-transporting ATPase (P-type)
MLELIMVLSAVLGKYPDLLVVSTLLVVNAVLSSVQERRAAGVVKALKRRLQVSARVLRDATWQVIPARELVPGDIVRVRRRRHRPIGELVSGFAKSGGSSSCR